MHSFKGNKLHHVVIRPIFNIERKYLRIEINKKLVKLIWIEFQYSDTFILWPTEVAVLSLFVSYALFVPLDTFLAVKAHNLMKCVSRKEAYIFASRNSSTKIFF